MPRCPTYSNPLPASDKTSPAYVKRRFNSCPAASGAETQPQPDRYLYAANAFLRCWVLNEVQRMSCHLNCINFQIARHSNSSVLSPPFLTWTETSVATCTCRGLHRRTNPEARDRGVTRSRSCVCLRRAARQNEVQMSKKRMPSFTRGCPAHNGSRLPASQNTSKPPDFLPCK